MPVFTFDDDVQASTFKGNDFFTVHVSDTFLADSEDVEKILCQGKKIRDQIKTLQPGGSLTMGDLLVGPGEPLIIKKGGPGFPIGDLDYTLNRLSGLCAAYAASQSNPYKPKSAMAVSLGLSIDTDRKLYFSATPGAEHFPEVFTYRPLLCAIKQLSLGKVKKENIARIAAVKNMKGKLVSDLLIENRTAIVADLSKFTSGGGRGLAQLESALRQVRAMVPNIGV